MIERSLSLKIALCMRFNRVSKSDTFIFVFRIQLRDAKGKQDEWYIKTMSHRSDAILLPRNPFLGHSLLSLLRVRGYQYISSGISYLLGEAQIEQTGVICWNVLCRRDILFVGKILRKIDKCARTTMWMELPRTMETSLCQYSLLILCVV